MRFIRTIPMGPDRLLAWLVTTERTAALCGHAAGPLAVVGLIATGLYLAFPETWLGLFSHGAFRAMHALLALVVLLDLCWRLARAPRYFRGLRGGVSRRRPKFPQGRPVIFPFVALPPVSLARIAVWGYWASTALLLMSGGASFIGHRYGLTGLPLEPGFGWGVLHEVAASYLLAFLALRLFLRFRFVVKRLKNYLLGP